MSDDGNAVVARSARRPARMNLKDMVADEIRDLIFSGDLRPGSKIDQDEIAEREGVSKLPVREALISLESEGLVENIPRRGAFVAPLSRTDIRDHFNVFGMVSGLAAGRAADELTDEDIKVLEDLCAHIEESQNPEEQGRLNTEFHAIINRAGGSRRLLSVIGLLGQSIPTGFFEFASGWAESAHEEHRAIVEALKARDSAAARREVEQHLRDSAELVVSALEERDFWNDGDGD